MRKSYVKLGFKEKKYRVDTRDIRKVYKLIRKKIPALPII